MVRATLVTLIAFTTLICLQNASVSGNLTTENRPARATRTAGLPPYAGKAVSPPAALPARQTSALPARNMMDARESERNARATREELKWSNSLSDAKQRAQEQGKLVFWVHMLGKLDGAT